MLASGSLETTFFHFTEMFFYTGGIKFEKMSVCLVSDMVFIEEAGWLPNCCFELGS